MRAWDSDEARKEFWVFSMIDGEKTHVQIGKILNMPEQKVRKALLDLERKGLVQTMESSTNSKRLLGESFDKVKVNSDYFAYMFYKKFFGYCRKLHGSDYVERLFTKGETDQNIINANMYKQYKALMAILAFAVASIIENKNIEDALKKLGAQHKGYGVIAIHYELAGKALIETFQEYYKEVLQEEWTEALQQTWFDVYTYASTTMQSIAA